MIETSYCFNKQLNTIHSLNISKLDLTLIGNLRDFIKERLSTLSYYNFICSIQLAESKE